MLRSRPPRFLATLTFSALLAVTPSLSIAGQIRTASSAPATPPITPLLQLPDGVATGAATNLGAYNPTQTLRLAIALKPPHLAEEEQFLRDLQDRTSPHYHKYLTPEEWNARFAPSLQDEQAVVDWATAQGLTVTQRYANRLDVDVAAPVSAINKALGIQVSTFQQGTTTFWSADQQPSIPATLQPTIGAVMGLSSLEVQHSSLIGGRAATLGSSDPYSPGPVLGAQQAAQGDADAAAVARMRATLKTRAAQRAAGSTSPLYKAVYDPTDLYSSFGYDWDALSSLGHCCNPQSKPAGDSPVETSIAIATGDAISFDDIAGFHNQYPYLAYHVSTINVDGTPTCCGTESTMDTEWATAMANSFGCACATAHVWVYQAPTSDGGLPISSSFDMMNAIVNDHRADAFSTSWGCSEELCFDSSTMTAWHAVFDNMLGIGMSLTAAAGDDGTTDSCGDEGTVDYPASDPDMTSAGGTTAVFGDGFQSETAWDGYGCSGGGSNQGGGGGGCSKHWGEPYYQSTAKTHCLFFMRMVPDVALNASHFQNIYVNGQVDGSGGTSIVAPELAGFFAEENAYLLANNGQGPFGQANVGFYSSKYQFTPHNPYYDVTSGCQGGTGGVTGNCAGAGFDLATGWGSFNALQLAWQFNWNFYPGVDLPGITFTGPALSQWYNTDQPVSWNVTDPTGAGIAGFTAEDGFDPGDPATHATPQQATDPYDSFYAGPAVKDTSGSLALASLGEGRHTVDVRAWNNMGQSSLGTYGWVGYDITPPVTTASPTGTAVAGGAFVAPVTVTLTGTDTLSGVASTMYRLDTGPTTTYSGPFAVTGVGQHLVTFYSTDNAGNRESAEILTFTIVGSTTTTLTGSANPTVFGQPVTFTASVAPQAGSGMPTGNVIFEDGATTLGTGTLSGGQATFSTAALAVGSHSITALYGGDSAFGASTSAALGQTVNRAGTTTALTASANPARAGQSETFTARVAPVAPGAGIATGTVNFRDGTSTLGTAALNSSGVATFATATLAPGMHALTAVYSGDAGFAPSVAAPLPLRVKR